MLKSNFFAVEFLAKKCLDARDICIFCNKNFDLFKMLKPQKIFYSDFFLILQTHICRKCCKFLENYHYKTNIHVFCVCGRITDYSILFTPSKTHQVSVILKFDIANEISDIKYIPSLSCCTENIQTVTYATFLPDLNQLG